MVTARTPQEQLVLDFFRILSTGDLEESHIKRALSNSAAETYVLISAEKLNAASPYVIAALSEVD